MMVREALLQASPAAFASSIRAFMEEQVPLIDMVPARANNDDPDQNARVALVVSSLCIRSIRAGKNGHTDLVISGSVDGVLHCEHAGWKSNWRAVGVLLHGFELRERRAVIWYRNPSVGRSRVSSLFTVTCAQPHSAALE